VAVSGEVARSFREVYGSAPAAIIPNGVDLERFGKPATGWRQANGFAEDDRLIASVARLEPQKNPLGLVEAFARALGNDPRWHLLMAGGGSLRDATAALAARLGIAKRVHLLGVRADIPELLAACDLFAMAADWEGSPMAVIEAMASGLPVVATNVGGVPELVEHGSTGLLVPPENPEALAESLAALALDERRRMEFGRRARERAARFGADSMVESYAQLFERVARGSK
jgi:glycosyltransferase involved in cell wall biosynthesis